MKRRELRLLLRAVAAEGTREPSPAFLDELEDRLRRAAQHAVPAPASSRATASDRRRTLRLAFAAAFVLAAAVPGLLLRPQPHELRLAEPTPTSPVLAPVLSPSFGPDGGADSPGVSAVAPPAAEPGRHAPTGLPATTPSGAPTAPPTASGSPVSPGDAAERPSVAPTPPERAPEEEAAGSTDDYPIALRARIADDQVVLHWSTFDRAEFEEYVILRAEGAHMPAWPVDAHTQELARVHRTAATTFEDHVPWRQRPVYRIVALDADGRERGRSRAVAAGEPAPSEPPPDDVPRRPALPRGRP